MNNDGFLLEYPFHSDRWIYRQKTRPSKVFRVLGLEKKADNGLLLQRAKINIVALGSQFALYANYSPVRKTCFFFFLSQHLF